MVFLISLVNSSVVSRRRKRYDNVRVDIRSMLQELGKDAFSFEGIYLDAYGR